MIAPLAPLTELAGFVEVVMSTVVVEFNLTVVLIVEFAVVEVLEEDELKPDDCATLERVRLRQVGEYVTGTYHCGDAEGTDNESGWEMHLG